MLRIDKTLLLGGLALTFAATGAQAQAQAQNAEFTIVNGTDLDIIGFQTRMDDGQWSDNWFPDTLAISPGAGWLQEFLPEYAAGACEVDTMIHFADGTVREEPVDYCDIHALNVGAQDQWTE